MSKKKNVRFQHNNTIEGSYAESDKLNLDDFHRKRDRGRRIKKKIPFEMCLMCKKDEKPEKAWRFHSS